MKYKLNIISDDQAIDKEKVISCFENIEYQDDEKLPCLKVLSDCNLENLKNINLNFWLKRAILRKNPCLMVDFCRDINNESLLYPDSFEGINHDGYKSLGIEYISPSSEGSLRELLPITVKGTQKALLLDRDGIINKDLKYVFEYEKISWVEGIVDLIKFAEKNDAKVVVLTNQSGIGRGLYTEKQMHELHEKMNNQLLEWDCHISKWLYCPYHTDGINEYKGYSLLRKPFPGMALIGQKELELDLENSVMIGDKKSDCLNSLDITTLFLQGPYDLSGNNKIFNSHFEIIDHLKKVGWV